MLENDGNIVIPVVYIELFVMLLGAFLIGYFFSRYITSQKYKKIIDHLNDVSSLENAAIITQSPSTTKQASQKRVTLDVESPVRPNQPIASQNSDKEQIRLQKRAFSEKVMSTKTDSLTLDFSRIGKAKPSDSDDLQLIVGIGPHTERKLNQLGIFAYRQIGNFNDNDIHIVTQLINFFPDRIKNDQWVEKARELDAKLIREDDE